MKVMLVNPPSNHTISSEIPDVVRESGKLPPLGLLYLDAVLRQQGHDVHVLDAGNAGLSAENVAGLAKHRNIEVFGVTATTHQMVDARLTLRLVAENMPKALRLIGGPHVEVFPEETAWMQELDAAFVGEAENSLPALLAAYDGQLPEELPPGVLSAAKGKLRGNPCAEKPMDLDALPFPDRQVLDNALYGDVTVGEGPLATIATSRGCPYRCTFCSTPGEPVRLRKPKNVADELEQIAGQGFHEVYFVDDTFNINPARAQKICEEIIQRKLLLAWTCRMRLDRLTPELLKVLKPAGCTRVQLGLEASTEEGMKALGKEFTPAQAADAVRAVRKAGVSAATYFLLGLPSQRTLTDVRHTVKFAVDLKPDYAVFNVLVPYPGTALYQQGVERGILPADAWRNYARYPHPDFKPPVWTEHLSAEQLYQELKKAYRRFYLSPRSLWRQANRLTPRNFAAMLKRARDIIGG